jgi:hypothetical protein
MTRRVKTVGAMAVLMAVNVLGQSAIARYDTGVRARIGKHRE